MPKTPGKSTPRQLSCTRAKHHWLALFETALLHDIQFVIMNQPTESTSLQHRRHGFTLIELLVVISIIALLIAILLPGLESARESARIAVCGSQNRQIALAAQFYAQDYNNTFPASVFNNLVNQNTLSGNAHWMIMGHPGTQNVVGEPQTGYDRPITEYAGDTRQIFQCPSDNGPAPGYPYLGNFPGGSHYSRYGTSYSLITGSLTVGAITIPMEADPWLTWHDWGCWGRNVDNFEDPALQVLTADWGWIAASAQEWAGWFDVAYQVAHGDVAAPQANMAFVDGHGEFLRLREAPDHYRNEDYRFASFPIQ